MEVGEAGSLGVIALVLVEKVNMCDLVTAILPSQTMAEATVHMMVLLT